MLHDDVIRLLLERRGDLLGYIHTILADRDSAEDVFQETLILASRTAGHFDHAGHCLAWTRSTARNLANNEARKAHRRSLHLGQVALDALEQQWAEIDDSGDGDHLEKLRYCIDKLSPQAKQLIRLRYTDGLDCLSIARQLGRSHGSIHVAMSRIYKSLSDCMQVRLATS